MGFVFLAHVVEVPIFAILLFAAALLKGRDHLEDLRRISVSCTAGLLIVGLVDLCAPGRMYTTVYEAVLLASALAFLTTYLIAILRENVVIRSALHIHCSDASRILVAGTLVFAYLLGMFLWNEQRDTFSAWYFYGGGKPFPWIAYALRFGVVGLLALGSAALPEVWNGVRHRFIVAWAVLTAIFANSMGLLASFGLSVWTAWRIQFYTFGSACILAGFALVRLATGLRRRTRLHVVGMLVIMLVVVAGLPSSFLSAELRMDQASLSRYSLLPDEAHALQAIDLSVGAAATPSQRSLEVLQGFIGQPNRGGYEAWYYPLLFRTSQPELAFRILHEFNVRYLYLAESDLQIPTTGYVWSHLIRYLPLEFNASQVSVYKVPAYVPPTESGTAFVVPDSWPIVNEEELLMIDMAAMSQTEYSIVKSSDSLQFSNSRIVTMDSANRLQGENLLAWVKNGGTLLVIDGNDTGPGFWSNYLGLSLGEAVSVDGVKGQNASMQFQPFSVPLAHADVGAAAWFTFHGSRVTPLVFSEEVGDGRLVYARLSAYYRAMQADSSPAREQMYYSMSQMLAVLGLQLRPYSASVGGMFNAAVFQGDISLQNGVQISMESAWIAGLEWLRANTIEIQSSNSSTDGLTRLPALDHNIVLKFLQVQGKVTSTIEAPWAEVLNGSGSYSTIAVGSPFSWTLTLENDSRLVIEESNGSQHDLHGGRVTLLVSEVDQSLPLLERSAKPSYPEGSAIVIEQVDVKEALSGNEVYAEGSMTIKNPSAASRNFYAYVIPTNSIGPLYYFSNVVLAPGGTTVLGFQYFFQNGTLRGTNETFTFDATSSANRTQFLSEGVGFYFRFTYRSPDIPPPQIQTVILEWQYHRPGIVIEGKSTSLKSEGLAKIERAFIAYPNSPLLRNQSLLTQGISFTIFDSGEDTFLVSDYAHGILPTQGLSVSPELFQWRTALDESLFIILMVSISLGVWNALKGKRIAMINRKQTNHYDPLLFRGKQEGNTHS